MEAALEVLGGGLAGSTVLARKGASMLAGEFNPGFRLQLHHKDLGIVQSAAREAGVVLLVVRVGRLARGAGGIYDAVVRQYVGEPGRATALDPAQRGTTRCAQRFLLPLIQTLVASAESGDDVQ